MPVIKVEKNRERMKDGMKDYFREDNWGCPEIWQGEESHEGSQGRVLYRTGSSVKEWVPDQVTQTSKVTKESLRDGLEGQPGFCHRG